MRTARPFTYQEIEISSDNGFEVKFVGEFSCDDPHPEAQAYLERIEIESVDETPLTQEEINHAEAYLQAHRQEIADRLWDELEDFDEDEPDYEPDYDTFREEQEFWAKQDGRWRP